MTHSGNPYGTNFLNVNPYAIPNPMRSVNPYASNMAPNGASLLSGSIPQQSSHLAAEAAPPPSYPSGPFTDPSKFQSPSKTTGKKSNNETTTKQPQQDPTASIMDSPYFLPLSSIAGDQPPYLNPLSNSLLAPSAYPSSASSAYPILPPTPTPTPAPVASASLYHQPDASMSSK